MKKLFKWLATGLLALFALTALGLICLGLMVDPNQYKSDIESIAKEAGLELTIRGSIEWQFLPLGVRVNQVDFAQQDQSVAGNVDQLAIGIDILKLLTFSNQALPLPLSSISAINGRLLYAMPNSLPLQISNINFSSSDIGYDGGLFPMSLSLQALGGRQFSFDALVGATFSDQKITGFNLSDLRLRLDQLRFTGDIEGTNNLTQIQGAINIQEFNLLEQFKAIKQFAPDLYIPQMVDPKALTNLALSSQFNLELEAISDAQATLVIDGQEFDINLLVDNPHHKLTTVISGDSLNLSPYSQKPSATTGSSAVLFAPLAIPLAVWRGQSQLELHLGKLELGNVVVSNIYANLFGNQSLFKLTSLNADVFNGQINATATLDMQSSVANFDLQSSIANLDLAALADNPSSDPSFGGILNLETRIQGSGNDALGIINSLDGDGNLSMLSPFYKDINIEQSLCNTASLFDSSTRTNQQWSEGTQLDDLTASFRFNKGQLLITDYQTGLGNISLYGDSTVDLLAQSYRFNATALLNKSKTSSRGCSVGNLLQNREIPFRCNGKFGEKARCRPKNKLLNSFIKKSATDSLNSKISKSLGVDRQALQGLIDKNLNRQ